MITKDGQAFYIVKIITARNHFGDADHIYPLTPGVIVSAGIVTGERTVLAYLLSPLLSTAPFALSER
jgi:adhesin transport system membrane fusion protein